ncbi:MAG: type III-B CRISPR module-associated protein Cmr5, partial [Epsilonproteobacteria bacterium]|nr:type III-B CRISPR module-associated protein Cmr5 [Campylobacterota bacterium]
MAIKDLAKERSQYAYKCVVEAVKKFDDKQQKEYKAYVKKIPMMILNNG